VEEYIKLNGVLLAIIWFSDNSYDNVLQIEALENVVREYRKDPSVGEYIVFDDFVNYLQMLVRNYVEHPDCPNDIILKAFEEYDTLLDNGERLAYMDEFLNYRAMRGELGDISETASTILSLPKGEYSDCYACILNRLVRWHLLVDDFQGASMIADKIVAGKLTCDLIPHSTKVQKILIDNVLEHPRRGNTKSAEKTALKNLKPRDAMVFEAYFLLLYARGVNNIDLALTVLERFKDVVELISSPAKVYYCLAAYKVSGERSWYDTGLALAQRFDARNGVPFYAPMFAAS
jgi:hypothetical protein